MSNCQYEMQQNANIRANNRIMEELGISVLISTVSSLATNKSTSKEGGLGRKVKRSGKNASQCEGSDLSDYIPEAEEPDDGDDDTDLEEEPTPLANEVHLLSWLRVGDAGLHISNAYRSRTSAWSTYLQYIILLLS